MRVHSIRDLAATVRGRRLDLGLSQGELAKRVGTSRKWVVEFETGKPSVELGLTLRVLDELGLHVDVSLPDTVAASTPGTIDLDIVLEEHRAP